MKITEIFQSIEGEGIRMGYPAVFIRLHGCNLRCSYCDSMYSVTGEEYLELSVDDVLREVQKYDCKRITLTGGEPLIHEDVFELIKKLVKNQYEVNIETNGAVDLKPLRDPSWFYGSIKNNLIITMDWKSLSSGMSNTMLKSNLELLRNDDVLKFVVSSHEDLNQMKSIITMYNPICNIFVSPIYGEIVPKEIVNYILNNNLNMCRMQLQLHKYIWPAAMRGV